MLTICFVFYLEVKTKLRFLIANWIGKDPMEMNLQATGAPFQHALYDIVGKARNIPAYKLMGDCYRGEVPVGYWLCYMDPKDTGKEGKSEPKWDLPTTS
ncbi:hypothetical protein H8E77_22770 [bacterium]|nr:hypothetical protein [bacterium]